MTTRLRGECRAAVTADELASHFRIRHHVFVDEQKLFVGSDRDEHDDEPGTIHVLAMWEGEPAGVVRLFPLDAEGARWQGDRLAVLPGHRVHGLGKPLVRFAVTTAAALGGREMVAHIQLPNVAFFERIGWFRNGEIETYVGVAHQPMAIALTAGAGR